MASSSSATITFNKRHLEPATRFGIDLITPREFLLSFTS